MKTKETMTEKKLIKWAKNNLLPNEDIATRLRFSEGVEAYDLEYIKEMHKASKEYNKTNKQNENN